MSDTNVIKFAQPGAFTDSLTEILRSGARALLTQAVEAEVAEFLAKHTDLKTETGQQRVVRHGHLPEREIMTSIGGALHCQNGVGAYRRFGNESTAKRRTVALGLLRTDAAVSFRQCRHLAGSAFVPGSGCDDAIDDRPHADEQCRPALGAQPRRLDRR